MVLFKRVIYFFFFFLKVIFGSGQTMEVVVKNNSPLPDSLIYVAVIGEDLSGPPGKFVWINLENGDQIPMGTQYNTVDGPSYGGDQGPGQNSKYADCFFPLESLDKGSFLLQPIQGCRIFIAQKEQLYLYFFDQIDVFGYAAPNKQNPNDPNTGIIYEIIELTFNQFGFFGNTTRVDAYHRPIRMELIGENNTYRQIVGEAMSHQNIIKSFQSYAPQEFTNCLDLKDSIISQPSKIKDFQGGGLHQNYFQPYVEKIWSKYRSVNLSFDSGEKGIWSGRVNEAGVLELKCIDGPGIFLDRVARIAGPPSTQEVIEGKGVLNQPIGDTEVDLAIQAQICAAINRHVINVSDENPGIQNWSDPQNFYKNEPANFYAGFWHQEGISINNLSYGFAYDDVWEQSSSLHTPDPEKLIIYFGDPTDCTSEDISIPEVSLTSQTVAAKNSIVSRSSIQNGSKVNFFAGESITLRPGFTVEAGAEFSASIQECVPSSLPVPQEFNIELEEEFRLDNTINVYPNPFTNSINIDFGDKKSPKSIEIYNIGGTLLRQTPVFDSSSIEMDMSNLENGIYIARIVGETFVESKRLIKF